MPGNGQVLKTQEQLQLLVKSEAVLTFCRWKGWRVRSLAWVPKKEIGCVFLNRASHPMAFQSRFRFCWNAACSGSDRLTAVCREGTEWKPPSARWLAGGGEEERKGARSAERMLFLTEFLVGRRLALWSVPVVTWGQGHRPFVSDFCVWEMNRQSLLLHLRQTR